MMLAMEIFNIQQHVLWAKRHEGGYECSSGGDKRFSAFYARMPDGRTLEQHYQCDSAPYGKGYDPGGTNWRLGKGKPPLHKTTPQRLFAGYLSLWRIWTMDNQDAFEELINIAISGSRVLTDQFAKSPINQARALAWLINEHLALDTLGEDYGRVFKSIGSVEIPS